MTNPDFDGDTITGNDTGRLQAQLKRVYRAMFDGQWRTLKWLASTTGDPETSVSARLRDLRKPKFGSYKVERRCVPGHRGLFEYRIAFPAPTTTKTRSENAGAPL